MSPTFRVSVTGLFVLAAAACGGSDPPPPVSPAPTATWGPTPGPGPSPGPSPTTTAPAPTGTTWPMPAPTANAGGGTASPLDPNAAQVATAALGALAGTEAPGMTPEGAAIAGMFQEGQYLEAPFTLQPGKCYTLLAAGVGPSVEVEMMYTTPIPNVSPSFGKGAGATQASVGGRGACLKPLSPIAAPAKFVLRATKGAGVAAAQLYAK